MIADGVVARLAVGQRADSPPENSRGPSRCRRWRAPLRCRRSAPQQVADVAGEASTRVPSGPRRGRSTHRPRPRSRGSKRALRSAACRSRSSAKSTSSQKQRASRAPAPWRRSVALQLAGGAGAGTRATGRHGRRSSPTSPSSTGSRGRSPRCAAGTRCNRCPGGRRRCRSSGARRAPPARTLGRGRCRRSPLVLVEQDEPQVWSPRSRSTASGGAPEGRQLPVAHLVQDPARGPRRGVVDAAALPVAEHAQGRRRELRGERQGCRLVRMLSRPNIVMNQGRPAAEGFGRPRWTGEKRNAASRRGCGGRSRRDGPSPSPAGRGGEPRVQLVQPVAARAGAAPGLEEDTAWRRVARWPSERRARWSRTRAARSARRTRGRRRPPSRGLGGRDRRRPMERVPLVRDDQRPVLHSVPYVPCLPRASFTSKRSAKSQPTSTRTTRSTAFSWWFSRMMLSVNRRRPPAGG